MVIPTIAGGQSWQASGAGVDGPVFSLAVYGNQLYAGGAFTVAGGAPAANIARWDGVAWSPLGADTNGAVYALVVHGGYLYVGGEFTSCGGAACSCVARWDGGEWTPIGSGMNGPVYAMAEYRHSLYAGGGFARAGSDPARRIATWDGTMWKEVSGGVDDTVYALEVTAVTEQFADLYIAGAFVQPGLARIAWYHPAYQAWRATEWEGFNAPVHALANFGGGIVAGGAFSSNGLGASVNHLALRGNDFQGGADGEIYALLAEGTNLFVGGLFTQVGPLPGVPASNIARWNGESWEALGSGTNKSVRAMLMYQGQLYAGGEFDSAGGTRVNHVARWGTASDVKPISAGMPVCITLFQNYPNPFNPLTTIRFGLPERSHITLAVFNILGQQVAVLVNRTVDAGYHEVKFDASGLSSGVYFYSLTNGSHVERRNLVLLR